MSNHCRVDVESTPNRPQEEGKARQIPGCLRLTSGGRGCLGEGRLGLPGQVWELRFLRLFVRFLGKISVPKLSGKATGTPRHSSSRHPLSTHTPLIKGVEVHPVIKGGMGLKKHNQTSGFGQSTPLIKGVNLHLLH